MVAGLPGIGLGGLFFIASALLMPFVELLRMLSTRDSGPGGFRLALRQAFLAFLMLTAVERTIALLRWAVGDRSAEELLPLAPVAISGLTLAFLLVSVAAIGALVTVLGRRACSSEDEAEDILVGSAPSAA